MVLHDLILSSRVHQDFVSGVQVSFFSHLEMQLILRILWSRVLHFFVFLSHPIFSVCGWLSPHNFWDVIHKSTTRLFFSLLNSLTNSIQSFLLRLLSISFVAQVVIFFSVLFIQFSFSSFQRFCVMSSSSVIPSCEVHVLFLPFSVGVLPKSFQSYSFLIPS